MDYTATIALKDQFSKIASRIENRFGGLTNQIKKNQAATADLKNQLSSFDELDKLNQKLTKVSNRYQEQEKRVALYADRIKKATKPTAQMVLQLEKAENRLAELKPALTSAKNSVNAYKKSMQGAGINTDKLSDEQVRLQKELEQTNKKIDRQAKKLAARNRLKQFGRSIKEKARSATKTATRIGVGASAIGAGAAGVALSFNQNQGAQAREIQATAAAFNIATQELQAWRLAVKPAGIEADKISDIFKDVSDKVGDFALTGGGEAKDMFEKLNLDVKEFKSLSPDQMLLKIGTALDKSKLTKAEKIFLMEGLANDAALLLPLLENNAEAINKAKENAKDYGIILSESEKKAFKDSQKGWAEVSNRLDGIKMRAGTAFNSFLLRSGAFDWINDKLEGLLTKVKQMAANGELQAWAERITEKIKRFATAAWETGGKLYDMGMKMSAVANKVADFVGGWDKLIAGFIIFKSLGIAASLAPLALALGTIGGAVAGAAALAGVAYLVYKNWSHVGSWFETNMPITTGLIKGIKRGIDYAFNTSPLEMFKDALKGIVHWVQVAFEKINNLVANLPSSKLGHDLGVNIRNFFTGDDKPKSVFKENKASPDTIKPQTSQHKLKVEVVGKNVESAKVKGLTSNGDGLDLAVGNAMVAM